MGFCWVMWMVIFNLSLAGGLFKDMEKTTTDTLYFDLKNAITGNGSNVMDIPLLLHASSEIYAADFEMDYDEHVLEFVAISNGSTLIRSEHNDQDGRLLFTSMSKQTSDKYPVHSPVVYLRFRALQADVLAADLGTISAYINGEPVVASVVGAVRKVAIDEVEAVASVKVYPNPVNNILYMDLPQEPGAPVQLYDMTSRLVHEQEAVSGEGRWKLDVSTLSHGAYYLKVFIGDHTISRRIIKY